MNIPKVLHQTWKTREMPRQIVKCIESMRRMNPGWDHAFYTDEDWKTALESNAFFNWEELNQFPTGIQRADIFRCLMLHEQGGIYSDVDTLALRPLDSLIGAAVESGLIAEDTEMILTTDHPVHSQFFYGGAEVIMNNFMVSRPGARFLEIFLGELKESIESGSFDNLDPVATTGPIAMTEAIERHGGIEELKIAVVPYFWINPLPDMARDFPGKEAYDEIFEDGSWRARFCPYVVHCWWHSWWDQQSMANFFDEQFFPAKKAV